MTTKNNSCGELTAMLLKELRDFEAVFPMTAQERKDVRKWVRGGNSANGNPWGYCYDSGWEMNYIDACRAIAEQGEQAKPDPLDWLEELVGPPGPLVVQ